MTSPSDREVFLNEVREAIEAEIQSPDEAFGPNAFGTDHRLHVEGTWIDTTDLAQAAVDAMVRRLGPEF